MSYDDNNATIILDDQNLKYLSLENTLQWSMIASWVIHKPSRSFQLVYLVIVEISESFIKKIP